ncbi:hypothetical protein R6Q59_021233 [Mikania micrantha]|uniref:Uncharacterized protein n=1 Tax=Mikania micrantha TaxID=192012 RepID=A0A5N6M2U0_9ASTR|nr:hypothetical protein E3N88_36120 [Mikania micrantha]
MGTSNLERLIISHPVIQYHHHQTPNATNTNSPEDQNANLASNGLKIQVQSSANGEFNVINREDNDPQTPRSIEHRIPIMATCPPAPRKVARRVPVSRKRKAPFFPAKLLPAEFAVYVDAMLALNEVVYVPHTMVGDLGKSESAKKLKLLPAALD